MNKKIIISMATFNRPAGLISVLDGIEKLALSDNYQLTIVVTDNSPDANAENYIHTRKKDYKWDLIYLHEKTTGISYARNTGLEHALDHDFDYIVFIDDDESPSTQWLQELLKVCEETSSMAVIGAVHARFQKPPPWWIIKGGYLNSPNYKDRQPVPNGYTTNAIVNMTAIKDMKLEFEHRYALTGGEDTLFFKTIQDHYGDILYAKEAITFEHIVPERAKLSSLMKYWYRTGNTEGIQQIIHSDNAIYQKLKVLSSGLGRMLIGTAIGIVTLPTLLFRQIYPFMSIRIVCRGLGYFVSVFGIEFQEYKNHNR
ncbi:MAG: glycosyltransferase family 2 protein [Gammaproteobacteria bacterium]